MKIIIVYKDRRRSHYYKIDEIIRTQTRLKLLKKHETHYEIDLDDIHDLSIYDDRREK